MKTLKTFLTESDSKKIRVDKNYTVVRDGGSQHYTVLNSEECGYVCAIQDFSIGAKRKGIEGRWLGMLPPPDHTNDKYVPIDYEEISFEESPKYK